MKLFGAGSREAETRGEPGQEPAKPALAIPGGLVAISARLPAFVQRGTSGKAGPLQRYALVAVFVLVVVIFSVEEPSLFLTLANLKSMLDSQAILLILAVGVTFTLRLGDLDLSFASVMGLSSILVGVLAAEHHVAVPLAITWAILAALGVGAINALLVVGMGLNSFIVTLGVSTAIGGVATALAGSQIITNMPASLVNLGTGSFLGVDRSVYYGWLLAAVVWYVYEYTPFGRYQLFAGGNREAARLAGLRVTMIRVVAYIASALIYGVAGIFLTSSLAAADPTVAPQYLLPPLAGAFLGLTAIQPGRFNVVGAIVGLYLLLTITTGIELAGASAWVGQLLDGVALVLAVAAAWLLQGRRQQGHIKNPGL